MRAVFALALLVVATRAAAAPPTQEDGAQRAVPRLGVALDAGVPAGVGALLQTRPLGWLRIGAGPTWSVVGFGAKGAFAVVAPFRGKIAPAAEIEVGYGQANLSFLEGRSAVPAELRAGLSQSRYLFASGLLGLDIGSPRGLSFMVRAGISHLEIQAPRTVTTQGDGRALEIGKGSMRTNLPAVKVGVQWSF
jgi:hypothetical protein